MSNYQLIEKNGNAVFKVTIKADVNDGDYLTTINLYSKSSFEKLLDELILLKSIEGQYDKFEEFEKDWRLDIPWDSQSGQMPHTIESIDIEYIDENGKLWDVKLN